MESQFSRTELLLGMEGLEKLKQAKVAVFGIGGVGGYVVEALVRSGVEHFVLVDSDTVSVSNLNRQIIATQDTIGKYKTEVMKERILSINKEAKVEIYNCFFLPDNKEEFDFSSYSYVVDAVDTVTAKIELIMQAKQAGVPIISSMGAGNKLNPTDFEVADIYKTSVCPLAKVMRRELKKRNIKHLKVVYSKEEPIKSRNEDTDKNLKEKKTTCIEQENNLKTNVEGIQKGDEKLGVTPAKRAIPGSVAFVPSVVGLIIASEVVKDLVGIERE